MIQFTMVGGVDGEKKKDAERYIFFFDTTVRSPAATIIEEHQQSPFALLLM